MTQESSQTKNEAIKTTVSSIEPTRRVVDFENVDTNGESGRVYLSAVVNGKFVLCMCDTGSEDSFLPYNLVDPKMIFPTTGKSYAANSTVMEILGRCKVEVEFDNQIQVGSDFLVSKRVACPMFSTKWLKKNTTSWDFASGTMTIQGYKFKLKEEDDLPNQCRKIMVEKDAVIPQPILGGL